MLCDLGGILRDAEELSYSEVLSVTVLPSVNTRRGLLLFAMPAAAEQEPEETGKQGQYGQPPPAEAEEAATILSRFVCLADGAQALHLTLAAGVAACVLGRCRLSPKHFACRIAAAAAASAIGAAIPTAATVLLRVGRLVAED